MVLVFHYLDSETDDVRTAGYVHGGQVLKSVEDDFPEFVEQMQEEERHEQSMRTPVRVPSDAPIRYQRRQYCQRPTFQLEDEISVIGRYKPPYGYYASICSPCDHREALGEHDSEETRTAPERPDDLSEVVLKLYRTPFDDALPTYLLRIYGTGFVVFDGRAHTGISGRYAFQIDPDLVADLVETVYDAGFFDLQQSYLAETAHGDATALGITVGTEDWWVYNYSEQPPDAFTRLQTTIEEELSASLWVTPSIAALTDALDTNQTPIGSCMAALRYYLTTAFEDTSTQRHLVSKVRPYLTHDLPTVRADALAICTELLEEHVDAADTAAITNRLDDPDETVREQALEACESLGVLTSPGWLDQTLATASNDQTRLLAKHLAEQATEAPTTIKSVTDELTTLLTEEDATVRQHATTAVAALAEASPESVRHMVPQLLTVLDDASEHARENACTALHRIGDEFPEPVIDAVPAVVPLLSDSTSDVQHEALRVLLAVGKDYPEEIKPAVPDIRTCLQNDTFPIAASATLGHLAKEYPQVAEPAIETYQQWLTDQNYRVRNNALAALADLADHYPDQVVEHNQTYIELLVDDDERVRYNATSVISKLAKTYSGAVRAATNTLSDLLDDDFDQTRQNVCWALGRLGATEAITDLKHIRTHDSAESVQAAATAALEMLERNECPHCGARVARCDMEIAIGYPEWVRWPCPECNQQVHRKIDHA